MIARNCSSLNWRWAGTERPAVVVAGQHRAGEAFERLPERLIGEVGEIEDDAESHHLIQQRAADVGQAQLRAGAAGVAAGTVVRWPNDAQARVPELAQPVGSRDRVGAFHADDEAQWQSGDGRHRV